MRMSGVLAATFLLQSCSYSYGVLATVVDGRLAFISADDAYSCIANVNVSAVGATRAVASPGDDQGLVVKGGAFWWTRAPVIDCTMQFPVIYGTIAQDVPQLVAAKPLRMNVVYSVNTEGEGAYGHGCFRITAARRIQDLSDEHCYRL